MFRAVSLVISMKLIVRTCAAVAAVSSSLAFATAGHAASLSASELLSLFNGVTQGDMTSNQEVEGRLYVGGNLSGNSLQVGFKDVAPSALDELIVVGNSTINTINAQNGSDVTIGGSAVGTLNLNGGSQGTRTARIGTTFSGTSNMGTTLVNQAASDANFADRFPEIDFAALQDESEFFATLTGAAVNTSDPNNKKIIGAPDASGLSVFTTSLSDLASGGYSIDTNGADTILINVSGVTGTFGMNALGSTGTFAENVIWNFYQATSINVNSAIIGSVLAPLAKLSGFNGSTEGSVIAREINLSNGELHSRAFIGTLPTESVAPPPPAVPLPAALPLLLAGLGGLVALRRRAA